MSGHSTAGKDLESRPESFRLQHRKMPKRAYLLGVGGLVLGLFAGFSIASDSVPAAPPPGAESPQTLRGPTPWSIPGDGVYIVGTTSAADVRPGLYRSQNNRECSWRTARDATFEHRSLVASDTTTGDAYVELKSGEFFDTNDCATWHRATGPGAPR